jgi:hypothetical protein
MWNGRRAASFQGQARATGRSADPPLAHHRTTEETTMRSILLYLIGVPLPIILLLAMCSHHF